MSNIMTAILLEKYIKELNVALEGIKPYLPQNMMTTKTNRRGEIIEVYPCLDEAYRVLVMMSRDMKRLRDGNENQN